MAAYPDSAYAPRTKENLAGVAYDAGKKTVGFVEDMTYLEAEVLAIIADLVGTGEAGGLKGGASSFFAAWTAEHSNAGIHTAITSDTINEGPGADGVTVDGVKCKDGGIAASGNIYTEAWADYTGTTTVGWVNDPPATGSLVFYKKVGNLVFVNFELDGTSNATNITFTVPYASANSGIVFATASGQIRDNGSVKAHPAAIVLGANSSTVTCYLDPSGTPWTNANRKSIKGQLWYEAA